MKHLAVINKYFWKYRTRLLLGILFILLSNYFRILGPQISGFVIDKVAQVIALEKATKQHTVITPQHSILTTYDYVVQKIVALIDSPSINFSKTVLYSGIILLVLALLSGFFLFLMRQTIIVMSRYIEYDQKNEVYQHYQKLDPAFYKVNATGDLMNRISEDVSRVRMYTGPALMYLINLTSTIIFCVGFMLRENWRLTLYTLAPLPILAITIYFVNNIVDKKSERVQRYLSHLTAAAQESYSGIRVIKSFVQEKAMMLFFNNYSESYKKNAIGLARVEAIYFPSIALLVGISTLLTIAIGCWYYVTHQYSITTGTIAEFVIYINLLSMPVSMIGWSASMIQRAAASQKRLNEFLQIEPTINDAEAVQNNTIVSGNVIFKNVSFIYPHTKISAIHNFSLTISDGEKILILGKTGSGKSSIAQLLLRLYNATEGSILLNENLIQTIPLQELRKNIGYVPQDTFLFSDTVANNINFSAPAEEIDIKTIEQAATFASVNKEIEQFEYGYNTTIGERGVMLSGGQKQRIAIARALLKNSKIVVFDDCLSAVDTKTEKEIVANLLQYLVNKTALIITHRIITSIQFDHIIFLENGEIVEEGTHDTLLKKNGKYATLYHQQNQKK